MLPGLTEEQNGFRFQSPQWGSNSKGYPYGISSCYYKVSVPAMGR